MPDMTATLFKAIQAKLLAHEDVAEIVGSSVFSSWGSDGTFPLIRISIPNTKLWDVDGDGDVAQLSVHCFVRGGVNERSELAAAVRDALDDLTLEGADLFDITYVDTINRTDTADAEILTAIVRFTATAFVPA